MAVIGNILYGQQDQLFSMQLPDQPSCIQDHNFFTNSREYMGDLKIIHLGIAWNDVFQELPELGNIPLVVVQFIEQFTLGFFLCQMKSLVETGIGIFDPEVFIKDQQGLANGGEYRFRIFLDFRQLLITHDQLLVDGDQFFIG